MIADGAVVGWIQGRAEFGPRALGNRSFLADPRRSDMRQLLNEKVKLREWFRPLAPRGEELLRPAGAQEIREHGVDPRKAVEARWSRSSELLIYDEQLAEAAWQPGYRVSALR